MLPPPELDVLVDLVESKVYQVPDDLQPPSDAELVRKGFWNPERFYEREKNFSHNFISGRSYNRKADNDFAKAREILTWFRAFTRNDQSDLSAPLPEHLVRDREFVAQAEALMRRMKKRAKNKTQMHVQGKSTLTCQRDNWVGVKGSSFAIKKVTRAEIEEETAQKPEMPNEARIFKTKAMNVETAPILRPEERVMRSKPVEEPGQYGASIKFGEHKTQLAPVRYEAYPKPWRVVKPKKRKKVKAPEMPPEQYARLHKNAVTVDISEKDLLAPRPPVSLAPSHEDLDRTILGPTDLERYRHEETAKSVSL